VGGTIYLGGYFTTIGGIPRRNIGAVDTSGNVLSWNPGGTDGIVEQITVAGNNVYVAGGFSVIGGQTKWGVAVVDLSGTLTSWDAGISSRPVILAPVADLDVTATSVFLGGAFEYGNNKAPGNFAIVSPAP